MKDESCPLRCCAKGWLTWPALALAQARLNGKRSLAIRHWHVWSNASCESRSMVRDMPQFVRLFKFLLKHSTVSICGYSWAASGIFFTRQALSRALSSLALSVTLQYDVAALLEDSKDLKQLYRGMLWLQRSLAFLLAGYREDNSASFCCYSVIHQKAFIKRACNTLAESILDVSLSLISLRKDANTKPGRIQITCFLVGAFAANTPRVARLDSPCLLGRWVPSHLWRALNCFTYESAESLCMCICCTVCVCAYWCLQFRTTFLLRSILQDDFLCLNMMRRRSIHDRANVSANVSVVNCTTCDEQNMSVKQWPLTTPAWSEAERSRGDERSRTLFNPIQHFGNQNYQAHISTLFLSIYFSFQELSALISVSPVQSMQERVLTTYHELRPS